MANTILLKGRGIRQEAVAAGAFTPGHLLKMDNTGKLLVHAAAKGYAVPRFAVENDIVGKEIGDAYAADDYAQSEILHSGCEVLGFMEVSAAAVVIGDFVESAGDGSFQKWTDGVALAECLEAVDNSANASSQARIKLRLL